MFLDVLRRISRDEIVWFLSRSFAFLRHGDPHGFATRVGQLLRDPMKDVEHMVVLCKGDGWPVAGAYLIAPDVNADVQRLELTQLWFDQEAGDLVRLVTEVIAGHPHEVAEVPLQGIPSEPAGCLSAALEGIGFGIEDRRDLVYNLSDVPPVGSPLVLEAWDLEADEEFRAVFEASEGVVSDSRWARLKRWQSPFRPDLWFIARETLDQEAVGYAFTGSNRPSLDGPFYLTAVGVTRPHRGSSDMLKRLVISILQELSALSPLGQIETSLGTNDPKLIDILHSLGFYVSRGYRVLVRDRT